MDHSVAGVHVWLDHYDARAGSGGVDVCGGPTLERRLRIPVSATVPHSASFVNISFGSTLPTVAGAAAGSLRGHLASPPPPPPVKPQAQGAPPHCLHTGSTA